MLAGWLAIWTRKLVAQHASVMRAAAVLLLMGPLMAGASLAVEYGRALKVRSELQIAAEAAVWAAAARAHEGADVVAATLRDTLDRQLRANFKGIPFAFDVSGRALEIRIEASVANALTPVIGKPAFRFEVTSAAPLRAEPVSGNGVGGEHSAARLVEEPESDDDELLLQGTALPAGPRPTR